MIVPQSRHAGLFKLEDGGGLSSLETVTDWQDWWRKYAPEIAKDVGHQGWVLLLLDAKDRLQELEMLISRIIKSKPDWNTTGWSEAEWSNVAETAERAKAWYKRSVEPVLRDMPEWAKFLAVAQWGTFQWMANAGRELRACQEQGYSTVVVERSADGLSVRGGGDAFLREVS